MKRIYVTMSEEEYNRLKESADDNNTTPNGILSGSIADLTYSDRKDGSNESDLANGCLGRQSYRVW